MAAGNITRSAINAALKELYKGQKIQDLAFDRSARPFLSMLRKSQDIQGKYTPFPVIVEDSQGISAAFATAQANVTTSELASFLVSTVKSYSVGRIETEALLSSKNDRGAFIKGLQYQVDRAINGLANDIETHLFRGGTGSIGSCDATVSGTALVLATSKDINNYSVGMELQFSSTDGGSVKTGTVTVVAVDRDAGSMTVDTLTAINAGAGVVAGDFIARQGDAANGSTNVKLSGLDAWVPASAPGSAAFFNVDRSVDVVRLGGIRYDGTGSTFEEAVINAASEVGEQGSGRSDVALMSFGTWRQLVNELGSKVQRSPGGMAKAGYDAIQVYGPSGPIDCIPCTKCPAGVIWLLELSSWELLSMESPVRIIDDDGNKVLRVYNQDAFEVRVGSYSQLGCHSPGHNCRISIS